MRRMQEVCIRNITKLLLTVTHTQIAYGIKDHTNICTQYLLLSFYFLLLLFLQDALSIKIFISNTHWFKIRRKETLFFRRESKLA